MRMNINSMTLIEQLRNGANDPMWADHCEMPKIVAKAAADEIECLRATIRQINDRLEKADELEKSFNLRWDADMRAIRRWQVAHPGNDLVWPDHADLVVWLLEQLSATSAQPETGSGSTDGMG